jgi:hypothetical protein
MGLGMNGRSTGVMCFGVVPVLQFGVRRVEGSQLPQHPIALGHELERVATLGVPETSSMAQSSSERRLRRYVSQSGSRLAASWATIRPSGVGPDSQDG